MRRLDPDDYYPVYGDDSTLIEDAPTSGRFYVRIARGNSHVMWGNFKTRIDGVELARYERALYGAEAVLKSEQVTSFGEPVSEVRGFAAQPGTLPQRDEFLGSGGSAYFLLRQDINQGSEQVAIEIRDEVTDAVIERRQLRDGDDYTIDYVQGVILLHRPLSSSGYDPSAVRSSSLSGNFQYLVVNYEYTPVVGDLDGYSYGGRAQAWLNDHFRIGVTGYQENTSIADQTLLEADVTLRLSEKTYFEFEWAQSEGSNFGTVVSTDGGFIFNSMTGVGTGEPAQAWRTALFMDLSELFPKIDGSAGILFETRGAGFNSPGHYGIKR